ncbi:mucin-5AC isoform X2 [Melanotaenia boesemani]|uniref:mucin-5AC isoform X2 n=1 Tax=Melanotaenia boesemani TaxID=1250792 RepID=UPI001C03D26F|nr:mucin-5AC isoform X2 [Melanotaenia boesemani]
MSTSDAAELKLRAAGETATPPCRAPRPTRTPAAKKQQDEAFHRFRPQSYHGDQAPVEQTHSDIHIQSSAGSSFTSSLSFKLSKPEGSDQSNQHPSLIETQLVGTKSSSTLQVNEGPSSAASRKTTSISLSSEKVPFPSKREEKLIPIVNHEVEATNKTHILSNSDCRPHEQNGFHKSPHGSQQRSSSRSVTGIKKDKPIKDKINQSDSGRRSDPSVTMLSSTVVTVLAPHWSTRLRRNKRFDGGGNSETQGNLQDAANTAVKHEHGFQDGMESVPRRVPLLGTRRNTVGWSAKSDPSSLDFESKRKLTQTVSLDPSATTPSTGSFHFPHPSEQRLNPQTGHQEGLSSLSSNPTTSSLLLSFRRVNSNSRNSNSTTDPPEVSPSPMSCSPSDRIGKPFSNNNQERPKPLLSPSPISYNTSEPGLLVSPTSTSRRDRNISDTLFFSASPENSPFTLQPPTRLTSSNRTFQGGSNKNTNPSLDSSTTSPRHSHYDHSTIVKPHSLPRRTTLTSTSWWKKVSQEGGSPFIFNDDIKNETKTNIAPSFNSNNDMASLSLTDNKRPTCQIPSNSDNNNTAKPVCRGNVNLTLRTQSTESERFVKEQYGSNLNKEAQKPRSILDGSSGCKSSRSAAQITQRPTKHDVSNTSFRANITELMPTESSKYKNNDCPLKTSSSHTFSQHMDSHRFSSLSLDSTSDINRQTPSQAIYGLSQSPNANNTFSFYSHPQAPSPQTPKFTNKSNITPIGFERNYACLPKPFQPKSASSLTPGVYSFSKTNCSPLSTTHAAVSSSLSLSSLSVTPPRTSPTSLLTPPATPVITSPSSDTSSPKGGRLFSNSPEREAKKTSNGLEGKKGRRVTWEDSVDVQCSEPDPPRIQMNPLSPSRLPQSIPSIFSFLRSGSPGRASNIQVGKGGKFRSFSSDSAEKTKPRPDSLSFDQGGQDINTFRQERTLSVESATTPCRPSAPLSLPPDFSNRYNLRYSSPPYSTLVSSRQAHGEPKMTPQQFSMFSQSSQPNYTPQLSPNPPIRPSLPLSSPFQKTASRQGSSNCLLSDADQINNNHSKHTDKEQLNSQIQLLDNRVHVSSQSLPGDNIHSSSSTYVTETLVYSIRPKAGTEPKKTTPKSVQQNTNRLVSVETKLNQPCSDSGQSSNGSSSAESRYGSGNRSIKESVLGKSRFYSVEVNNEQSSKRSRFALRKSVSTPSSDLSKLDSERVSKGYNRMDQVFNRLRQKFSTRRSDEDVTFPWKWKRSAQVPSVSGLSDVSSVSDNSADSIKTLEDQAQETRMDLSDGTMEMDHTNTLIQNDYTVIPAPAIRDTKTVYQLSVWSETSAQETEQNKLNAHEESFPDREVHLAVHVPTNNQFDLYENNKMDYTATNQLLPDPSPITTFPNQSRKSTPSPRSPFSPFSSLSPLSPFSPPDVTDDSVFFSPKLQRRRESSSPCEPREGISLGGSRRSRASTGPPSVGPGQDKEQLASSYANLKYGIEPGRSFSVSSVLSSRPSGPGRISTGSRFMSVGDLSQSAFSCRDNDRDFGQCPVTPDWTEEFGFQPPNDSGISNSPTDPSKMRSRSLPRSLTRCLTNWSSGVPSFQPASATSSKPARLRSPNMSTCHFAWEADGPPTPPPTPPLSPVARRMAKPPGLSSPTFPTSSGALQQAESQSSRGGLSSRDYVSSLGTFDESSDSSSDTTTDDEYYLETDQEGEKETEL